MKVKDNIRPLNNFFIKYALLFIIAIVWSGNSYGQINNQSKFSFQKLIIKYEGKVGDGYYYSLLNLTDSTFNNITLNATFFDKIKYAKYSIKFNLIEGDYSSIKIRIDTLRTLEVNYFILPKLAKDISINFSNPR
jgi:hypothetical protein